MRRRLAPLPWLTALAVSILVPAAPAAAQQEPPDAPADSVAPAEPTLTPGDWGALDVAPRPGVPVVVVSVALPVGSSQDPEDRSGTAWLLGATLRELVLGSLSPEVRAATEIQVDVDRSWTVYRLVTLPEHWAEGLRLLNWALFESRPPAGSVDRARTALDEVFTFETDAPVRDFEKEFYRLVAGTATPWTLDPRGDPVDLERITTEELTELRARHYRQAQSTVSVVGRVTTDEALSALTEGSSGSASPADGATEGATVLAATFRPLRATAAGTAWESGERAVLTREVTSSWIGAAWPVNPELHRTVLDLLVHRLDRQFHPSPPDPGAFHVEVYVEWSDAGPLLMVEAAVLPEATDSWERRIVGAVEDVRSRTLEPAFFRSWRRRFRTTALLAEAPPEAEGRRRALDLLREGQIRDLEEEIRVLTADDLQRAAAALGPPRLLVYGPDLGDGTSR